MLMNKNNLKRFIIFTTIFTISSIVAIWIFWQNVLLLTFVLLALAIMELLVLKSKEIVLAYFLIIFGGVLTEIVAVYLGAWQYTLPSFWGIPLWLLPAWGNAGIIGICVYRLIKIIRGK
jgi:hypothetical protein